MITSVLRVFVFVVQLDKRRVRENLFFGHQRRQAGKWIIRRRKEGGEQKLALFLVPVEGILEDRVALASCLSRGFISLPLGGSGQSMVYAFPVRSSDPIRLIYVAIDQL